MRTRRHTENWLHILRIVKRILKCHFGARVKSQKDPNFDEVQGEIF